MSCVNCVTAAASRLGSHPPCSGAVPVPSPPNARAAPATAVPQSSSAPVRQPEPGSTLIGPCTPFPRRPLRCFAPPAPHLPRAYLLMYCSCDCTSGAGLCWSGTKGTSGPPCCRAWRCCSTTSRNLREAGCCGSNSSAFSAVTMALSRGRWTQETQCVGGGTTHLTLWCCDSIMRRGMAWYARLHTRGW